MTEPVRFGINIDPAGRRLDEAFRLAKLADSEGIDLIGIQDHPYIQGFVDTLTLITSIAARTGRVHLFPNVANLPLRPPAMLAKQAATIDRLSQGRFELGLGAGSERNGDAIAGMGGPRRTTGQAREAMAEAIDVLRHSWAAKPYAFEGAHYSLPRVEPGPRPAHEIGIWLGVRGPRALRLLGEKADGWSVSSSYMPAEELPGLNRIIDGAAREAGRDPGAITRLYNVMGTVGGPDRGPLEGPVERWVETLRDLATERGMNAFVFWPLDDHEAQIARFIREVVPAAREALA